MGAVYTVHYAVRMYIIRFGSVGLIEAEKKRDSEKRLHLDSRLMGTSRWSVPDELSF